MDSRKLVSSRFVLSRYLIMEVISKMTSTVNMTGTIKYFIGVTRVYATRPIDTARRMTRNIIFIR
jgi:hypothetical protein